MKIQFSKPQTVDLLEVPVEQLVAFARLVGGSGPATRRKMLAEHGESWPEEVNNAAYKLWDKIDDFLEENNISDGLEP